MILAFVLDQIDDETDQQFMTRLYHGNIHVMMSIARKHISDEMVCEDVIQEALSNLIPKIPKMREMDKDTITAYAVAAVKNTALTYLRKQSLESKYIFWGDFPESAIRNQLLGRQIEEDMVSVERALELYGLLQELPEKDRELLFQKYYLQLTDAEIAQRFHCGTDSVRMMLTRARRRLLKQIQKGGCKYEFR